MADDEKEMKETLSRGNEWEVVSLTASTYAAAPGPERYESKYGDKGVELGEDELSRAMFMSHHFVFPPSQHENLPLEPDNSEIHYKLGGESAYPKEPKLDMEEGFNFDDKSEENLKIDALTSAEELPGIRFFNEKGKGLSVYGTEFEEGGVLQELNLVGEGKSIYSTGRFHSFHAEADISGSTTGDKDTVFSELQRSLDSHDDFSEPLSPTKGNKNNDNESGLPCEAWWKRRAASLYTHAKEGNAFWSVFVAAALMGLIILGQRWQQERWKLLQLKGQCSLNDEKMSRMLGPIARFKDVIVGGNRRGYAIKGSTSSER